jgi:hypothetical protein
MPWTTTLGPGGGDGPIFARDLCGGVKFEKTRGCSDGATVLEMWLRVRDTEAWTTQPPRRRTG